MRRSSCGREAACPARMARLSRGHAISFPRFAEAGACPERIAPRRSAGWRWHGDGVRRPARCMRPKSRPTWGSPPGDGSRFMSRAMPWPGPSGLLVPIMLRPGVPPSRGMPGVVNPRFIRSGVPGRSFYTGALPPVIADDGLSTDRPTSFGGAGLAKAFAATRHPLPRPNMPDSQASGGGCLRHRPAGARFASRREADPDAAGRTAINRPADGHNRMP